MPFFNNDGIKIYYEVEGEGPPVILIHGFAASLEGNWKQTNWVEVLKNDYKVILLDCRGHGKSDKPLDPAQYGAHMTDDIIKLLDYLEVKKANFFGYSMGSRLTFELLRRKQELFISAILGGFVFRLPSDEQRSGAQTRMKDMIEALEANVDEIKNPAALRIRRIISAYKDFDLQNLDALAAVLKGGVQPQRNSIPSSAQIKESLKKINVPVLTVVGSDDFPGDKTVIAQLVPDACHFQIQGRDHINVVPDPKFHMMVKAFLDYVNKI
ncbi:MAG: alpha/beta fold hydrolase [Candidatus Thorarchaeota archaeon]